MFRATTLAFVLVSTASVAAAQQGGTVPLADQAAGMCQAAIEAGCTCYQPSATFQPQGAQLTVLSNDVLVSRNASSPQAATGASALVIGDRVITGEAGTAVVAFPNGCQINLQNQSLVTITQVEDCACAAPVQAGGSFGAQTGGGNLPQKACLCMTMGGIGAGAIIQTFYEDGDGNRCDPNVVSPPASCTPVP